MKIVAVYDLVTKAHLPPIVVRTTDEGLRVFSNSCKDPSSNFAKNPSDYNLVELGEWDEVTGEIKPYTKPIQLANASQHLQ